MILPASGPCHMRHHARCGSGWPAPAAGPSAHSRLQPVGFCVRPFVSVSNSLVRRTQLPPVRGACSARHCSSGRLATQRRQRGDACVTCSLQDTAAGLGLFFTPSILATIYAGVIGKGNVKDGYSKLLTQVSSRSDVLFPKCALSLLGLRNLTSDAGHLTACATLLSADRSARATSSRMLGGENIPSATGELSDLAGDEPLFKSLFKWSVCATNG